MSSLISPKSIFILMGIGGALGLNPVLFGMGSRAPKAQEPPPRVLKKLISIDRIKAKPLLQNGVPVFDIEQAMNLQAYTAAIASREFTVKLGATETVVADTSRLNNEGLKLMSATQDSQVVLSYEDSCLASIPVLRIDGEMLDLQLISETGGKLRLDPKVGLDVGVEAEFRLKQTHFNAVYTATDAQRNRLLHSVTRQNTIKEKSGSFLLKFIELFTIGFDHYKITPIAKVVEQSLTGAFMDIANATRALQWEAPVIVSDGEFIAINAGFDAGIAVGDQFLVQNRTHYWRGEPCKSEFIASRPENESVAEIEIYDLQPTYSWAKVVRWNNPEQGIRPGARVQVKSLVKQK